MPVSNEKKAKRPPHRKLTKQERRKVAVAKANWQSVVKRFGRKTMAAYIQELRLG